MNWRSYPETIPPFAHKKYVVFCPELPSINRARFATWNGKKFSVSNVKYWTDEPNPEHFLKVVPSELSRLNAVYAIGADSIFMDLPASTRLKNKIRDYLRNEFGLSNFEITTKTTVKFIYDNMNEAIFVKYRNVGKGVLDELKDIFNKSGIAASPELQSDFAEYGLEGLDALLRSAKEWYFNRASFGGDCWHLSISPNAMDEGGVFDKVIKRLQRACSALEYFLQNKKTPAPDVSETDVL